MTGVESKPGDRLAFKTGGGIRLFEPSEIVWIEADGKKSVVHAAGGSDVIQLRLGSVMQRLHGGTFARVSRFAIVNLGHVMETAHKANGDHTMKLSNGRELVLSRLHRAEVLRRLMPGA